MQAAYQQDGVKHDDRQQQQQRGTHVTSQRDSLGSLYSAMWQVPLAATVILVMMP